MAKTPNNDTDATTEAPRVEQPIVPAPRPVEPQPTSPKNADSSKRVTLVKGDHKVTTNHPVEINNYRARGYQIQK